MTKNTSIEYITDLIDTLDHLIDDNDSQIATDNNNCQPTTGTTSVEKKKRTSKKNNKVSLLDIDKQIFKMCRENNRWVDFMLFSQKIQKNMENTYDFEMKKFWQDYTINNSTPSIAWVNPQELRDCEAKIRQDKDRLHTSCFRNIQINKTTLKIDDLSKFNQLEKEFPNFIEVINLYKGFFVLNSSRNYKNYQAPRPLLLLGNPGIGKTRFAKRLAQVLGTDYKFLDSNSITSGSVLTGNNASWRGADAGFIFKTLAPCSTLSPVILFDEIDKLSTSRSYSPFSSFHQLLEPENSTTIYDEFLELEFNGSFIIYILTANNIKDIPESLLTRMNVVDINNPNPEQMREISQNIYTELLSGSKLFKKQLSEQTLTHLEKLSPREVHQLLSKNLFQLSANQKKKTNNDFSIVAEVKKEYKIGF